MASVRERRRRQGHSVWPEPRLRGRRHRSSGAAKRPHSGQLIPAGIPQQMAMLPRAGRCLQRLRHTAYPEAWGKGGGIYWPSQVDEHKWRLVSSLICPFPPPIPSEGHPATSRGVAPPPGASQSRSQGPIAGRQRGGTAARPSMAVDKFALRCDTPIDRLPPGCRVAYPHSTHI